MGLSLIVSRKCDKACWNLEAGTGLADCHSGLQERGQGHDHI